ncbi:hypothetical protein Fcan01_22809 [Folsomia candida]|uniref:Uncharacterized protein n=1 Tax=Folsomia candida TaxID=158441 RepID=A0A226DBQ7_FOLCA|nr:hypothetical protein Fcan01_22809 [Folsomia candida]
MSEVYTNEATYAATIEKQTPQWVDWCILELGKDWDRRGAVDTVLINSTMAQLALKIFAKANVTKSAGRSCYNSRIVQLKFDAASPHDAADVTLIHTNIEGYQFITCYTEPYVTLWFYLTPFQPELWVLLLTTIGIIISLTTVCQHFCSLLEHQPFSAWMYVLASLFEETGFVPTRIEKQSFFRISLGVWSIMSVVLTNGYNGIMISELNSPRRQSHAETFGQLVCTNEFETQLKVAIMHEGNPSELETAPNFPIWYDEFILYFVNVSGFSKIESFNSINLHQINDVNDTVGDSECYSLLSPLEPNNERQPLPEFLSVLRILAENFNTFVFNKPSIHQKVFIDLNLFSPRHAFFPKGFSYLSRNLTYLSIQRMIERGVVKCGKTAYVAKSSKIIAEYEFLSKKYPDIKFFVSTETVQSYPTGISLNKAWRSSIVNGFKSLGSGATWRNRN